MKEYILPLLELFAHNGADFTLRTRQLDRPVELALQTNNIELLRFLVAQTGNEVRH